MPDPIYGDITARTAGYVIKELLERGAPELVLEQFGQPFVIPGNASTTAKFRGYTALPTAPKVLTPGVTPTASKLSQREITATLDQLGDFVKLTDIILDTHEDPILNETTTLLAEQAVEMIERYRFNKLKAGTNVIYATGSSRSAVKNTISKDQVRRARRNLKRQLAKPITKIVRSTASFGTQAVAPSYIALVHSDLETDIRDMAGFVAAEDYGSITPYPSEIGKIEQIRFVAATCLEPWVGAGATDTSGTMLTTEVDVGGTPTAKVDVYPVLILGANAYGLVCFKGKHAVRPLISNPKPQDGDELAQRGSAGWKALTTAVILNDAWMTRLEVACGA